MTTFFRLLPYEDKATALSQAIDNLHQNYQNQAAHTVDPNSFRQVPGSPFAYWVSENIRRLFTELPSFGSNDRSVQVGVSTQTDFRFLRLNWEINPTIVVGGNQQASPEELRLLTFEGKPWVPFAKGGSYSPYYSDLPLLINWENCGKQIENYIIERYPYLNGNAAWLLHPEGNYFVPGLTWPRRTQKGLSIRALSKGCIFGNKGPAIFASVKDLMALLGITNSVVFRGLVALQMAFGSYEVGVIQRTVIPDFTEEGRQRLGDSTLACVKLKQALDGVNETSHLFTLPAFLQSSGASLTGRAIGWQRRLDETAQKLGENQRQIDDIAFSLYGIEGADRQAIEESLKNPIAVVETVEENTESEEEENDTTPTANATALVADLLSWAMGCAFGRWDVRLATSQREIPELPDPFAPLPACSPGMLTGEDGLPVTEPPEGYPLSIDKDGILVEDPKHSDDIVRRVQDVIELLWGEKADAIEQEACTILGVKSLRDYFRNPSKGGFWFDHISRYSKSRRKAPIYWLLQSSKKNYGLWLYYHKLDKNTLHNALMQYVEPKLRQEQSELEQLKAKLMAAGEGGGKLPKQLENEVDKQLNLVSDVQDFHDKLKRVADLYLEPDLNDGVVLNIAPLRELVPWAEAKRYWEELSQGKYEWSSMSQQLRQKGVVRK